MADDRERLAELTKRLRANPRRCPNCGGRSIRRLDAWAIVVGRRRCRNCRCLWEPPWSRSTAVTGIVVAAFGVLASVVGIAHLLRGLLGSDAATQSVVRLAHGYTLIDPFIAPFLLVLTIYAVFQCAQVLRGVKGQGKVIESGSNYMYDP